MHVTIICSQVIALFACVPQLGTRVLVPELYSRSQEQKRLEAIGEKIRIMVDLGREMQHVAHS
jgi:hypothetical protein